MTFGKVAAKSVTYLSGQALAITSPAGTGLVDVRVQTAGGTSAISKADRFFFGSVPSLTRVTPQRGPTSGGTIVTITGTSFTGATAVTFGGVPATSFAVESSTRIQARTPAHQAGAVSVAIASPAGVNAPAKAATFTFSPATGYVTSAGGVTPIATTTARASSLIKVPDARYVAITPDGGTAYVTSRLGVTPIRTATNTALKTIRAGKNPQEIAITPNGKTAYVVSDAAGTVTPIRTATNTAVKAIKVGTHPDAIAITPNGASDLHTAYAPLPHPPARPEG